MYGLVLEGGGARGSYHMGAYRAIMEEGLEVKAVAGTSIGALNGAMIVQGDYERCIDLWHDIKYSMIIDANDEEMERLSQIKLDIADLRLLSEKIKAVISGRGFDITPFKDLLNQYIDEEKIRKSELDFAIVTVNLTDFKPIEIFKEDIPLGELKDYLLASAYLPAFKTERIGGKRFLDGGFYDNLPFKLLLSRGYDDLIIVRTHAKGLTRKINPKINAIVISPTDDIGGSYIIDPEIARRNMELGYFDGLKAIRGLKGIKYYIEPIGEEICFEKILKLTDDNLNDLKQLVKTPNIPNKRALLEHIIPKIASVLGLYRGFSYEDFMVALLETKAEEQGIERFKIYSFEKLLELVKGTPVKPSEDKIEYNKFSKFIGKVDLSKLFNKEEIIRNVADIILST